MPPFREQKHEMLACAKGYFAGREWAESIAEAIPGCSIFLLVFSSKSNISKQVLREVELAVSQGLIIVPARIEDIKPTGGMAYYLSTVHWIDIVDAETERNLSSLAQTISDIMESGDSAGANASAFSTAANRKKRSFAWIWAALFIAVVSAAALLYYFKDSLFDISIENTAENTYSAEPAVETPLQTAKPTSAPAASPTATVDPNIALDTAINIPDPVLRTCIIDALEYINKPVDGRITAGDMLNLKKLYISEMPENEEDMQPDWQYTLSSITSIEGLQYAFNLEELVITGQEISDISPLSQIYRIEILDLSFNHIKDLSPLSGYVQLKELDVELNWIMDISVVSNLTSVEYLNILSNGIMDYTPLLNMPSLQVLNVNIGGTNAENYEVFDKLRERGCTVYNNLQDW